MQKNQSDVVRYIRLTLVTGKFVLDYSKECKKMRLEQELFTNIDKEVLDKMPK